MVEQFRDEKERLVLVKDFQKELGLPQIMPQPNEEYRYEPEYCWEFASSVADPCSLLCTIVAF
jgi:hypothetical protein